MTNSIFFTPAFKRSVKKFTSLVRLQHQYGFASNNGFVNAAKGFDDGSFLFKQLRKYIFLDTPLIIIKQYLGSECLFVHVKHSHVRQIGMKIHFWKTLSIVVCFKKVRWSRSFAFVRIDFGANASSGSPFFDELFNARAKIFVFCDRH